MFSGPTLWSEEKGPPKVFNEEALRGSPIIDPPILAGTSLVSGKAGQSGLLVRKVKVGDRVWAQFAYDAAKPLKKVEVVYHLGGHKIVECLDVFASDAPMPGGTEGKGAGKDDGKRKY